MNNALQSYVRHLIVTGLLLLLEKLRLPVDGAEDAMNIIALAITGTLSWLVVKYGSKAFTKLGVDKKSNFP